MRPGGELMRAGRNLRESAKPPVLEQLLEGREPALIVAPSRVSPPIVALPIGDLGDQPLAELLPLEEARLVQRHGEAKEPRFPGRVEDQFAVLAGRRRG